MRWRAATPQQLMGNLPRKRVVPAKPFLHTGVDNAGPIQLRTTKGRGHRSYKAFVAIFVCLASRAVHLEVVSDYTAEAFLAALRRFVSRRGLCRSLQSDCGTTFVGADSKLRALFSADSPTNHWIVNRLASEQIEWRFNPPSAPHFGGIWEAAVKSLKHHLRRVLGDATLIHPGQASAGKLEKHFTAEKAQPVTWIRQSARHLAFLSVLPAHTVCIRKHSFAHECDKWHISERARHLGTALPALR